MTRTLLAILVLLAWQPAGPRIARAAGTDRPDSLATSCRAGVNDDRLRPYDPALREGALRAFGALFPDARQPPADAMLQAEARFRCMDGRVYACFTGANLSCGKIDLSRRNAGASAFCRDNPSAEVVPMAATGHDTAYAYRCREGRAAVARILLHPDPRGFARALWAPADAR